MYTVGFDTGDGKQGIVVESKKELGAIVQIRDILKDILESDTSLEEKKEEILGMFTRSKKGGFSKDNPGMLVVSDKVFRRFREEWNDVI